jgi:lipopolysaccharide export system permease protein
MKKIDRLIAGELVGPWAFGVAMFTSLILAATYLGRITNYIVEGLPISTIVNITFLMIPAMLVKTLAMSTLLGALLAFGRLSGDSEIVALRAGGASIYRIIWPVAMFSFGVAIITFFLNDTFVPQSVKKLSSMTDSVRKDIQKKSVQPVFQPIIEDGVIKAMIMAEDFNLGEQMLSHVTIKAIGSNGKPTFYMEAAGLHYESSKEWKIIGPAILMGADGKDYSIVTGDLWPGVLPKLKEAPENIGVKEKNDPDFYTSAEIRQLITKSQFDKSVTPKMRLNFEYWLWSKYSVPLAALVFGILGAALGIRSHRAGTATGFALAVGIMFAYMTIANFMNVWAQGGIIPPFVASFTPIVLGLGAALVIMWRRNTG